MSGVREFNGLCTVGAGEEMRAALAEDGIFVVRNVLDCNEVSNLDAILRKHLTKGGLRFSLGRTQPNAAEMVPNLSFIFAHQGIIKVLKQILGEHDVVFTGHCDIHMNMLSGWHKDSGETVPGGYFRASYMMEPECRVFKVAIYLQDTGWRDGLTARLGSHREADLSVGEIVKVNSRVGDIVVFDVRISHTGQLPDPVEKGLKGLNLALNGGSRDREDSRMVSFIKEVYWKLVGKRDRLSVFYTYGAPNAFTYDFAESNMSRQARQGAAVSAGLSACLAAALESEGVHLWVDTEQAATARMRVK